MWDCPLDHPQLLLLSSKGEACASSASSKSSPHKQGGEAAGVVFWCWWDWGELRWRPGTEGPTWLPPAVLMGEPWHRVGDARRASPDAISAHIPPCKPFLPIRGCVWLRKSIPHTSCEQGNFLLCPSLTTPGFICVS